MKIYTAPFSKMSLIPAGVVPISIEENPPVPYSGLTYDEMMGDHYETLKEEMDAYGYTGLTKEDHDKMSAAHQDYVFDSMCENLSEEWDEYDLTGEQIYKDLERLSKGQDVCILCCEPLGKVIEYRLWNDGGYDVTCL